jgi:hypothetical protein
MIHLTGEADPLAEISRAEKDHIDTVHGAYFIQVLKRFRHILALSVAKPNC